MSSRLKAADAAAIFGLSPRTIHKWVREGRLTRYHDGYDLAELLEAEASRNYAALLSRAGIRHADRPPACTPAKTV